MDKVIFTAPFGVLGKQDAMTAGGKGASLGEMTQAGIPVPPGFVVLASTFDHFVRATHIAEEIDAALEVVDHRVIHTIDAASERIKRLIEEQVVPDDIAQEIVGQFHSLDAPFVAVRSSATAEDGSEHAWAGQLETYLNTTETTLLEHVKKCWASLFAPRAIFYRFEKGLRDTTISVAVVVQKMVQSEKSGIAFSVHPITQDPNQLIIEAGFGLGEAVVSGTITPDAYVLRKEPREIVAMTVNKKSKALVRGDAGGNQWKELSPEESSAQVLSEDEIFALASMVIHIEKHYGFPCDIEWAFERGSFFITQSRPITTLAQESEEQRPMEYKFMWGQRQSAMITEAMLSQVLEAIGDDGRPIHSGVRETLFVLSDGIFAHYLPDASIEDLSKNSGRYARSEYAEMIFRGIDEHVKDFFKFCEEIRHLSLSSLSASDLKSLFERYHRFLVRTFHYFATSTPSGTSFVVGEIRKILAQALQNPEKEDDYFVTLSTPSELDETMRERLDFLRLVEQDRVTDEELEQYARRYPALFFNTYHRDTVLNFLRSRLEDQRRASLTAEEESNKMHQALAAVRRKQAQIYEHINDPALERYATLLQHTGLGRYRLKHTWSGGEYLCLDLILETQRRIGLPLEDLIKTYTFSDIIRFLDAGERLSDATVRDRKRCFIMHYYDGSMHTLVGDEAVAYRDARIPIAGDETLKTRSIKGDIANKGNVRGRARVVFVEDLDQFVRDSALFKKDEILVTTMTSPVMIPIIEKAGAIVTDEGGICSHAAISAREFKIPCIIGTHNASSVIKTGDLLEVDAHKGIVTIVASSNEGK